MRRCIERAVGLGLWVLMFACSSPPPDRAPAPASTSITEAELRAALAGGAALPPRPKVRAEAGVLDLGRIPLEDRHAAHLERVDFSDVRELDLSETGISPGAVRGLCAAPGIEGVERLVVDCYGEGEAEPPAFSDSAVAIAQCAPLSGLRELSLLMCSVGDKGAQAISAAAWTRLVALDLPGNEIGPTGATALAGAAWLRRVERLRMEHNRIGASGVRALLASGVFGRAQVNLAHGELGDESGRLLLAVEGIRQLDFTGNAVSEQVARELTEKFGSSIEVD